MKKINFDKKRYRKQTMKVIGIVKNDITGVRYGLVEVPVMVEIVVTQHNDKQNTTPVNTKKQGKHKPTFSKQENFEQRTKAAQKSEKPQYSERITIECPYHFFENPQASVNLSKKQFGKVRTDALKGQRQGKQQLQDYFTQYSNYTPETAQEAEWLAWIDYLEGIFTDYEETPEEIAKDFVRNGIGLTALTDEEIHQIRLNFLLSEANTSVR